MIPVFCNPRYPFSWNYLDSTIIPILKRKFFKHFTTVFLVQRLQRKFTPLLQVRINKLTKDNVMKQTVERCVLSQKEIFSVISSLPPANQLPYMIKTLFLLFMLFPYKKRMEPSQ